MDYKKEIVDTIVAMSGRYAPYNIFSDWVQMCAISIQNSCWLFHDKQWKDREKVFAETAGKYNEKELDAFAIMLGHLGSALEEEMNDVLGEIYMQAGIGSKYTGQFFTPFHLSELSAKLAIDKATVRENKIRISEPSCGAGGMIIAACKILHENGFDYQRNLDVLAQDLDWKGVYMTYLQLSLIGCRAVVVQGDTLCEPYTKEYPKERVLRTPAMMGALL